MKLAIGLFLVIFGAVNGMQALGFAIGDREARSKSLLTAAAMFGIAWLGYYLATGAIHETG